MSVICRKLYGVMQIALFFLSLKLNFFFSGENIHYNAFF